MLVAREDFSRNIPKLENLFARSFQKKLPSNFLNWRYLSNPIDDVLATFHIEDEQIVANYSASPCRLSIFGETQNTALSMTTMTDPDHAGKGLFTKLATSLYDGMVERKYYAIWGFPNNNSHSGFIKRLGWKDIAVIPTLTLDCSIVRPFEEPKEVARDDDFDLNYSELVPDSDQISVVKDATYLKWRYANHPTNTYQNRVVLENKVVTGFCVSKEFNNDSLDITDLSYQNLDQAEVLLRSTIHYAVTKKIKFINLWCSLHSPAHLVMEKLGFKIGSPLTYLGARSLQNADSEFYDFRNWRLNMGDSDVY